MHSLQFLIFFILIIKVTALFHSPVQEISLKNLCHPYWWSFFFHGILLRLGGICLSSFMWLLVKATCLLEMLLFASNLIWFLATLRGDTVLWKQNICLLYHARQYLRPYLIQSLFARGFMDREKDKISGQCCYQNHFSCVGYFGLDLDSLQSLCLHNL